MTNKYDHLVDDYYSTAHISELCIPNDGFTPRAAWVNQMRATLARGERPALVVDKIDDGLYRVRDTCRAHYQALMLEGIERTPIIY